MKPVSLFVAMSILVPCLAAAQSVPPPPPPPPVPAAPAAAPPAPPAPPALPAAGFWPAMAPQAPVPPLPPTAPFAVAAPFAPATWADASTYAAQAAARAGQAIDSYAVQDALRMAQQATSYNYNYVFDQQGGFAVSTGDNNYTTGLNREMSRQYEQAIAMFDRVIIAKTAHADGALFHKAWCQAKLGRADEASSTLAVMKKDYAQSPYMKDARALEADVKKLGPDQVDDEEIKLLVISGMDPSNPQTIPLLEKQLTLSTNSIKLKGQALYVLAGIDQPRAHELVLSYAKGAGNPDLQLRAISYLGGRGRRASGTELIDIYNSTTEIDVRRAVISAFTSAGNKDALMSIYTQNGQMITYAGAGAGQGQGMGIGQGGQGQQGQMGQSGRAGGRGANVNSLDSTLKGQAINGLSGLATPAELWPLYQKEENKDLRNQWVSAFASMGAVDQLVQIVKNERDPSVRLRAVRSLGNVRSSQSGTILADLYGSGDKDTKMAVIAALGNQSNAESLVVIAKKETDKELSLEIIRHLVDMKNNKIASDYLICRLGGSGCGPTDR